MGVLAGMRALMVTVSVVPLAAGMTVAVPIGVVPRKAVTIPPEDAWGTIVARQD